MHSGQVLFVTRMLSFCSDVSKVVSESDGRIQKQQVVDMLNSHVAKIEALINVMKGEAKTEESAAKNNAAMGIEIVIRYLYCILESFAMSSHHQSHFFHIDIFVC